MNNKTVLTLTATAAALFLAGCNDKQESQPAPAPEASSVQVDATKTEQSQDLQTIEAAPQVNNATDNLSENQGWQGQYHGILPCADCEGIETSLMLNADNTFTLTSTYLGKNEEPTTTSGMVKWNTEQTKITLMDASEHKVGHYAVSQGSLTKLDKNGEPITGDLAAQYTLKKGPKAMEE